MDGHNGVPLAEFREQTVEIALGPKGAFEDGNVGNVTRRVATERVVSAVSRLHPTPKPPREPRTPRIVELLGKAIAWRALLESGEATNQADIARREGITRARVTQVMRLLRLAPRIQEHILALPDTIDKPAITERTLRPITQITDKQQQLGQFDTLVLQS